VKGGGGVNILIFIWGYAALLYPTTQTPKISNKIFLEQPYIKGIPIILFHNISMTLGIISIIVSPYCHKLKLQYLLVTITVWRNKDYQEQPQLLKKLET